MKRLFVLLSLVLSVQSQAYNCPSWLDQDFKLLRQNRSINLCELKQDKALLLVNTASECGFTPQFKGLEALHQQYQDQGLVVIGFPSDSFFQEYQDAEKTAKVCYINYGVTFTMLSTSKVRGKKANPVFKHLGDTLGSPKWNFNKYLIAQDGQPIAKFGAKTKPESRRLNNAITALLTSVDAKPLKPQ